MVTTPGRARESCEAVVCVDHCGTDKSSVCCCDGIGISGTERDYNTAPPPPTPTPYGCSDSVVQPPLTDIVIVMSSGLFSVIVQELCESRGGRPGLSVLTSFLVFVDVKQY